MMLVRSLVFWITQYLILFITAGCDSQALTPDEYMRFMAKPGKGLRQEKKFGTIKITAAYQPTNILIARNLEQNLLNEKMLDSIKDKYDKSLYFIISMSDNGEEMINSNDNFTNYSNMLNSIAYGSQQWVSLITDKGDTLHIDNFYLDRTYNKTSENQLLVSFSKPRDYESLELCLTEFGMGLGIVRYNFEKRDIESVPLLKVNKLKNL